MKVLLEVLFFSSLIISAFSLPKIRKGGRIIGGHEVQPHSVPYQAALFIHSNSQTYFSSGALISPTTVLSVARSASISDSIEIVLGAHYVFQQEDSQTRVNATTILIHPDYNEENSQNDIAILRFDEIALNDYIQPVLLPTRFDFLVMFPVRISGWGSLGDYEDLSDSLYINPEVYDTNSIEECQRFFLTPINETIQFCTDGNYGDGVCDGDNGDPLVDDFDMLSGLVSYINPSGCYAHYPAVHTRIYPYLDWIGNNTDVIIEDGPRVRKQKN